MSERKLGFFVQIKEDDNFNRRNTTSISRINPAVGGIESDADMGEKDSFRSGTIYNVNPQCYKVPSYKTC